MEQFKDPQIIPFEEITKATNTFHKDNYLGGGGFGLVYKGELSRFKERGMVAFKRLDRQYGQGEPEFLKEISMLSQYKHKNLITLLGYCMEGKELILVYEYAAHGSLDFHLGSRDLTWTQRLKICLQAAEGLRYLHDPNESHLVLIHRDIKSANILLDDKWNAKVSDFGLSKISPEKANLVTYATGTCGYSDPQYYKTYSFTEKSDVYSFGVTLFEVLCGRFCYEIIGNNELLVFVHKWMKSYEQNKIEDIIFKELDMEHIDVSSLKLFSDISYKCLNESREERPSMAEVVTELELALQAQEDYHMILKDPLARKYIEIVRAAVSSVKCRSIEELKELVSEGVLANGGKTWLSMNEKGEHIERIYIEACLTSAEIEGDRLQHLSDFFVSWVVAKRDTASVLEHQDDLYPFNFFHALNPVETVKDHMPRGNANRRFPGGRCYKYDTSGFEARVRCQYLTPQISYTLNIVFLYKWETEVNRYNPVRYKIDGEDETKVFIIYPSTHMREDEWFIVPFYHFTSRHSTADLQFEFEGSMCELLVAGFEFQPSEEKVELPVFEEYQDILKLASQSLFYTSHDELKQILSQGVHLNGYKTWFSLNKKGQHCHMISMEDCLIPSEDFTPQYNSCWWSRFPRGFYQTNYKGFKTHVKTQLLSPSITYTVNLVSYAYPFPDQQHNVDLKYRLRGETTTSTMYLANQRYVNSRIRTIELFQLTSDESVVELEITFDNHGFNLQVEGILFQPMEKAEDPLLEDDNVEDTQTTSNNEGSFGTSHYSSIHLINIPIGVADKGEKLLSLP